MHPIVCNLLNRRLPPMFYSTSTVGVTLSPSTTHSRLYDHVLSSRLEVGLSLLQCKQLMCGAKQEVQSHLLHIVICPRGTTIIIVSRTFHWWLRRSTITNVLDVHHLHSLLHWWQNPLRLLSWLATTVVDWGNWVAITRLGKLIVYLC